MDGEKTRELVFSHDYEKLPGAWEGTEAMLIAVCQTKISTLETSNHTFLVYDSTFRGEQGRYVFRFEDALILVFFHLKTGLPFTTIRRMTPEKLRYYQNGIDQPFILRKERS